MVRTWWILLVILLTLTGAILRYNLLLLMGLLLGLIGGVSWAWTRYCLAGVRYARRLGTTRLFWGEETDFETEVVNAKPLPLAWLRVEDEFPLGVELNNVELSRSHKANRRILATLLAMRWYERVTRRYHMRAVRRGVWRIGPAEITSGDIFGFELRRTNLPDLHTLLIYPKIVPITALGLPAQRPFGDLRTPRRLIEDPLKIMGAREYVPGDSYRHIHWRTTARRQELHTKVFEPSASRPVAIFLNVNTFNYRYEGRDAELQEYAISATASIARWAWDSRHAVGLYVNSITQPGAKRIRIQPARQSGQLAQMLEALARVVTNGRWPLETVLHLERSRLPYGSTLVVVTPVLSDPLRQALIDLKRQEHRATLITLGDEAPAGSLPDIQHYHIGGKEEWHALTQLELA